MRHSIYLTSTALCASIIVFAQKPFIQTDADAMNLKGKVKSVKETKYDAKEADGNIAKADELDNSNRHYEFDENGNNVSETYFDKEKKVVAIFKRKFKKPGLISEELIYKTPDQLLYKRSREYDQNDFLTKITEYDDKGKPTLEYSNSRTFKYVLLNPNKYYRQEFDVRGKLVTGDSIFLNTGGNIGETISQREEFSRTVFLYKPGTKKPFIIRSFNKDGKMTSEKKFSFDKDGNETVIIESTKMETITPNKNTITKDYVYDDKGNWTKCIEKDLSDFITITERELKYY